MGFFSVPFSETLSLLFPWALERKIGIHGPYIRRVIRSEDEFARIEQWMDENNEVVFIRSLLDSCVACAEHQLPEGGRSHVGTLERAAKYQGSAGARSELTELMVDVAQRLWADKDLDAVCAVPPSTPGNLGLPAHLAKQVAAALDADDISDQVSWNGPKPSIKNVDMANKWAALDQVGLTIDEALTGRNVLIIDDMYQSGATIHYLASELQEAGAESVHCLSVVKARRDTDNA